MTGRFPLEMLKKKSVEALSTGQYRANAELSFELGSAYALSLHAMVVQNTTFTNNFVPIERFDGWSVSLGDAQKKNC